MAQDTLTLARCREMALENNKQMAIAEQNQEKASALVKAYRANFLPKISATGLAYYTGMDNDLQIPVGDVQLFDPTSLDGSIPPGHATHLRTVAAGAEPILHGQHTAHRPPCGLEQHLFGGRESRAARVYGRENRIGLQNGQDRARTGRTEPPPDRSRSHRADR